MQINIQEAKTGLSRYIRMIETAKEDQIIIARHGKPVVKMTIFNDKPVGNRIGAAKGRLKSPKDIDRDNNKIAELFGGKL